jgi:hypothetical protein
LTASVVAAAFAFGVASQLEDVLAPVWRLLAGAVVMAAAYAWILLVAMGQKPFFVDLVRGLRRVTSGGPGAPLPQPGELA